MERNINSFNVSKPYVILRIFLGRASAFVDKGTGENQEFEVQEALNFILQEGLVLTKEFSCIPHIERNYLYEKP